MANLLYKEKAQELYAKFSSYAESGDDCGSYDEELARNNTIQCALIAVQEIISLSQVDVDFWQNVQQELLAMN